MKKFFAIHANKIFLAISLIVILSAYTSSTILFGDGAGYAILSYNLAHGNGYSIEQEPHYHWMWGFPIFSALFSGLFGVVSGIKVASVVAGIMLLALSYYFFRIFFDRFYSSILSMFLIINPYVYFYIRNPHSEAIYTALALLLSICLFKLKEKNNAWIYKYLLIGLILGMIVNVRITGILIIIPLAAWIFFDRKISVAQGFPKALDSAKKVILSNFLVKCYKIFCVFLVAILMLLPWIIRSQAGIAQPTHYFDDIQSHGLGIDKIIHNIFFYLNPINSILPVLFLFMVAGIVIFVRQNIKSHSKKLPINSNNDYYRKIFYVFISLLVSCGFYIFWVASFGRFMIPAMPYMLVFAGLGIMYFAKKRRILTTCIIIMGICSSLFFLGMYSDGRFNNYVDKKNGIIPDNMHLFSEYEHNLDKIWGGYISTTNNSKIYLDYRLQAIAWNMRGYNNNTFVYDSYAGADYIILEDGENDDFQYSQSYELIYSASNPRMYLYRKNSE